MQHNPAVSIILPVYNQGISLTRAIESVLQQTFSDWELIVVNDGSNDSSAIVAKKFAELYPQIKFLDKKHHGVSAAINTGVAHANGLFVTTLGADDYYKPEHLQDNLDYIKNHPEVDLVMAKTEIIGSPYVVDLEKPGKMIHLDECAIGGTFFVRRSIFLEVGGRQSIQYGTDYFFAQKVAEAGFLILKRDSRTYVYDRTGSVSITKSEEVQL